MDDPKSLQALLDRTQDKIVVVDESGTFRYANAAVERILGFDTDEFVGTNTFEYIHPDDSERVEERFRELVETDCEVGDSVEYRHRTADDGWVWLESRVWNRPDAEVGGYVVSSRDVTDRKRAESERREARQHLEQLAGNTDDVLWMFSADWDELLYVNDAYEDIWGFSTESLAEEPQTFLDGIHPEDRDRVREAMEQLSGGRAVDFEYRVNPGLDYRRWAWVKGQPIVEDGEVTRIVGFARDVTDRRRRDRQLRVVDHLLRHNVRNDMNVILGHAELAREDASSEVVESMDTIVRVCERLLATARKERTIVDVLSRIGGTETFDLVPVVSAVVEEVRATHPNATVGVESPESVDVVALPEVHLAVRELLENAVVHGGDDPSVDLAVEPREDEVVLVFEDDAPPIPPNEYQPLFRDEDPTELAHGTGLGLWLVYWVADLSDGGLEFERHAGGNVVVLTLPRGDD